jgi:hypothetical protein
LSKAGGGIGREWTIEKVHGIEARIVVNVTTAINIRGWFMDGCDVADSCSVRVNGDVCKVI